MKIHRFYLNEKINIGKMEIKDQDLIHQIKSVLKLKSEENIVLYNGDSNEASAVLKEINKKNVICEIINIKENGNEPKTKTHLFLAILKKENFEVAVQKAVECGISEITPLLTEKTVKLNINTERIGKIIKEASEQSGRGMIPVLNKPISVKDLLPKKNELTLFFDKSGEDIFTLNNNIENTNFEKMNILIGPEGGWSDDENNFALRNEFKIASLGKLTLRAETAVTVASYLANRLFV
ncbi:MAG: 16S rRNA (uracil(1498)-N(3))-methyltransferase [Candidatus Pacebacteria bacterium]|nr:16S rRNA (uracil(1498)-N(3))-methyltransferase [Candidatus Paceibacterota bacterium]